MNELSLKDIYRTLEPITAEYTFFPQARRTFSKIDGVLGHKTIH